MAVKSIFINHAFSLKISGGVGKFCCSGSFTCFLKKVTPDIKHYSVFLLLSLYFCFCNSNQQDRATNTVVSALTAEQLIPEQLDSLQQTYIELGIEELFWRNRVTMSRDASIDLAIDLVDSTVYLDIKGVTLRKTRISQYLLSRSILYLKSYPAYKTWLSRPFVLKQDTVSSLPKEPVFIKDLATYPLEYFDDWTYFTRLEDEGPVHYLLEYDRGLLVQVDQDSDAVSTTELPDHWIQISIPAVDAKAIYRALAIPSELSLRY